MPLTGGPPDYFKAVSYTQMAFYNSSIREDGQTAVMHAQIKYSDLLDFEKTMKGFCQMNGTVLQRYPPQEHYQRSLFVTQVDFVRELSEPAQDAFQNLSFKDPAGVVGNGLIEVAVTYESAPDGMVFEPDSLRPPATTHELWRAVRRRIENDVTSQQLPKLALAYAAGSSHPNAPVPAVGAVVIGTATLYYTVDWPLQNTGHPEVPTNLEGSIASGVGTINSATFDGKYPKYTLLCLAPKRQIVQQADGSFCCRMTYVFAQRGTKDVSASDADSATPDWTRILNGSTDSATAYSRINRVGAPTKFAYGTSDFTLLFTP